MKSNEYPIARKETFKVVVAGGRSFNNYPLMKSKLDKILKNKSSVAIVSGKANGADTLGERYANEKSYEILEYPAQWDKHGRAAGYLRNKEMAKVADAVVCFWDGKSKGTKHMIDLAKKYDKPIRIIHYNAKQNYILLLWAIFCLTP